MYTDIMKWFRLVKDMYHIICLQRSILVNEFNNGTRRNMEYIFNVDGKSLVLLPIRMFWTNIAIFMQVAH